MSGNGHISMATASVSSVQDSLNAAQAKLDRVLARLGSIEASDSPTLELEANGLRAMLAGLQAEVNNQRAILQRESDRLATFQRERQALVADIAKTVAWLARYEPVRVAIEKVIEANQAAYTVAKSIDAGLAQRLWEGQKPIDVEISRIGNVGVQHGKLLATLRLYDG